MPIDELAKRVLAIYPSRAKNPLTSVRSPLCLEHAGKTLVFLDHQTIVPLRVAMQGVRFRFPLTSELAQQAKHTPPQESYTPEQAPQVYRFTAALWNRPQLWRRLEIQGGQTLADFDAILREAFRHDTSDHLGGFWRLVRRGTVQRFREVDLGDIDPFGGGSGAGQHLAGLGLQPGDALKYVYDFGDWIEHRLTLEEVAALEKGATYPRIVAQNAPQYQYCQACQQHTGPANRSDGHAARHGDGDAPETARRRLLQEVQLS